MCGIAGVLSLNNDTIPELEQYLAAMNSLQQHRGPDGEGIWIHPSQRIGFAHRRLSIIDLQTGDQPMSDANGNWIAYNGEIYNYIELRQQIGEQDFRTTSDTEVVLHAYRKWGMDCVNYFQGMFAFALWDEKNQELFCARDRFGIKPFYYLKTKSTFYFSSEAKALLPFISKIETDLDGLKDYLTFQFCLDGKTLFKNIHELMPSHILRVKSGGITAKRYWNCFYALDFDHTKKYFEEKIRDLLSESVRLHLRSDVPLGAYVSGGIDSSTVASLAHKWQNNGALVGFTGKFSSFGENFDESRYAKLVSKTLGFDLFEVDITVQDFIENVRKAIYHLDYPVAGPGTLPQYIVSRLASQHRKVVLGGQGGDEIFGGYTRYLIAYFEQCIKGAIDGTMNSERFIVTYESIIPNLVALRNYKPLMQEFWREGLFESMDRRYYRLVNRASSLGDEINWALLGDYSTFETFKKIFNSDTVHKESYFDLMTHFDLETLLPALLQVEDRMGMAHGIETRVPLLYHPLIELAATIPANIKFSNGTMKHIFKEAVKPYIPSEIISRPDKMGFPTPFTSWIKGEAKDFVHDIFSCANARQREIINNQKVLDGLVRESEFGRKMWGFLSLELWQQEFHDREAYFKGLIHKN